MVMRSCSLAHFHLTVTLIVGWKEGIWVSFSATRSLTINLRSWEGGVRWAAVQYFLLLTDNTWLGLIATLPCQLNPVRAEAVYKLFSISLHMSIRFFFFFKSIIHMTKCVKKKKNNFFASATHYSPTAIVQRAGLYLATNWFLLSNLIN